MECCGGWLPRRTTGACCWRQRCTGGVSSSFGCMLDSTEPQEVCRLHYCLGEPRRLCRRGMPVHGATRTDRPVWVWLSSWRRRRLGVGAGALSARWRLLCPVARLMRAGGGSGYWRRERRARLHADPTECSWFVGGTIIPASLCDCADTASLSPAKLVPAGALCSGVSSSIGSEPEAEPWSAVAAACPVARQVYAVGSSSALVARVWCTAACKTRGSRGRFVGSTSVPASLFYCVSAVLLPAARPGPAGRLYRRGFDVGCCMKVVAT